MDGRIGFCCNDILGEFTFGDLNKNSLKEILESEKYKTRLKMAEEKTSYLCKNCREFKVIK